MIPIWDFEPSLQGLLCGLENEGSHQFILVSPIVDI